MEKRSLVKLIYLYLFSLVGLVLIIVGAVKLINLGLKTYVLTEADRERYTAPPRIPQQTLTDEQRGELEEGMAPETLTLTAKEQNLFRQWQEDYEQWRERNTPEKQKRSERQEEAAEALPLLIVGAPLYWYHWKRAIEEKNETA